MIGTADEFLRLRTSHVEASSTGRRTMICLKPYASKSSNASRT